MHRCGSVLLLPVLLLIQGFWAAFVVAIPSVPGSRVESAVSRCSVGECPTWPSAVHIEGELLITSTASNSGSNATVTGTGTAAWSTMGDPSKPGSSLSYARRFETIGMPGEPAGDAMNTTTEVWQIGPQHKQYGNVSSGLLPSGCVSLPMPCFHRYDPVSLAIAACKAWAQQQVGSSQHFAGTRCDFAGFHIPGQTGTFDAWYVGGKIAKFQTNTTTTTSGIATVTSETVTVTSYSESPDPSVFHSYCKP